MKRERSSSLEAAKKPKSLRNDNHVYQQEHDHDNDDLPEDLLHASLVNLPLKQIFMFKSVSKRWNSIISSPFFSKTYLGLKHPGALPWTLLYRESDHKRVHAKSTLNNHLATNIISWCDFPFPSYERRRSNEYKYTVVSSSNGLLLCRLRGGRVVYAICNPLTRQWFVLPQHKVRYSECKEAFVTKVAEAEGSNSTLVTSFKVIRLRNLDSTLKTVWEMEIYDSEADKWTQSELTLPWPERIYCERFPVCFKGIAHWESCLSRDIIAFDPWNFTENEKQWLIKTPIAQTSITFSSLFDVCNGKLQYLERDPSLDALHLWVLEDYDKGIWELKHTIMSKDILALTKLNSYLPLAFHPFDPNIIYMTIEYPKKLIAYDAENRTLLHSPVYVTFGCVADKVFPCVLPVWPSIMGIPNKGRRRLKAMKSTHNNSKMNETCGEQQNLGIA